MTPVDDSHDDVAVPDKGGAETVDALASARPSAPRGAERAVGLAAVLEAVLGESPDSGDEVRFGRFIAKAQVGAGGMGVVYRGWDERESRPVAIKVVRQPNADLSERFEREVEVLRALEHPTIVRYYDHGRTHEGALWLAMEWIQGTDLQAHISAVESTRPPPRTVLKWAISIAEGLAAAHESGVIHRDLKPANLLLADGSDETLRIIDFGIARGGGRTEIAGRLTATGGLIGSPNYMAPEQLRGQFGPATDVYGLGATVYEILGGRPPFTGSDPAAIMLAILRESPPALSSLWPDAPPELEALVHRMLAKDPAERPPSMAAVITECAGVLSALGRPAVRPVLSPRERADSYGPIDDAHPEGFEQAARTIGRAAVLGSVEGILAGVLDDFEAGIITLAGEPGTGKTHVLRAVERGAEERGWTVVKARGEAGEVASPYSGIRQLLSGSESPAMTTVEADLAELLEDVSAQVQSKSNPHVLADRIRLAWLSVLDQWAESGPRLVSLDNAPVLDLASLRFIDLAVTRLQRCPLAVVVTTGGGGQELPFVRTHPLRATALSLGSLRPRSARRLLTSLLSEDPGDEAIGDALRIAGGNPAMICAVARDLERGDRASAASLAERAWRRLDGVGGLDRRVLRAAGIVGLSGDAGELARLLDLEPDSEVLSDALHRLERAELLAIRDGEGARLHWRFRDPVLRQVAYERSDPEDLVRGHAEMARYLATQPAPDPRRVARHYALAGVEDAAVPWWLAAARQALAAADTGQFEDALLRAEAGATEPRQFVGVQRLRAVYHFWKGELNEALAAVDQALPEAQVASREWYELMGVRITAAGNFGRNDDVYASGELVLQHPPDEGCVEPYIIALCRVRSQLDAAQRPLPAGLVESIEAVDRSTLGPAGRAWRARSVHFYALYRDYQLLLDEAREAQQQHMADGDARSAALLNIFLGSARAMFGARELGYATIQNAIDTAERLGASYLGVWARYTWGKMLTEERDWPTIREYLESVRHDAQISPRISVGALVYLGQGALRTGHYGVAVDYARAALATEPVRELVSGAHAVATLAAIRKGDLAVAEEHVAPLEALLEDGLQFFEFGPLVRWAWAAFAEASGQDSLARERVRQAVAVLYERARPFHDQTVRNSYLTRRWANAETFALARALGVSTADPTPGGVALDEVGEG